MPLTILSGNPSGSAEDFQDSAMKIGNPQIFNMPAPTSFAAGPQTLTAAQVLNGIVISAGSAGAGATAITLPTAAVLAAGIRGFSSRGVVAGDTILFLLINGNSGAGALTMTSPGASVTFDTNQSGASQVVAQNSSKDVYLRFTNGAPGSEAYVVYS